MMTKMTMISHIYWPHASILHDVPTDHGIRVMPFLLAILWAYGNCNMRLGEYGRGWNWSIRRRCSMHRLCRRLQARCWWWWSWWRWRWWIRWPALLSSSALSEIISKTMPDIENPKSTNQKQMKIEQSDNSTSSSSSCFRQLRGIPIPFQLSAYTFLGICMTMHGFLNEECWT